LPALALVVACTFRSFIASDISTSWRPERAQTASRLAALSEVKEQAAPSGLPFFAAQSRISACR
jgi:hypothetical protein